MYNDKKLIELALKKKRERKAAGMSLAELLKEYPIGSGEHRFKNIEMALTFRILAEHGGEYWALSDQGKHITITKTMAEKGWSLHIEKRIQKYEAWFDPTPVHGSIRRTIFFADPGSQYGPNFIRVDKFDFEVEIYG